MNNAELRRMRTALVESVKHFDAKKLIGKTITAVHTDEIDGVVLVTEDGYCRIYPEYNTEINEPIVLMDGSLTAEQLCSFGFISESALAELQTAERAAHMDAARQYLRRQLLSLCDTAGKQQVKQMIEELP